MKLVLAAVLSLALVVSAQDGGPDIDPDLKIVIGIAKAACDDGADGGDEDGCNFGGPPTSPECKKCVKRCMIANPNNAPIGECVGAIFDNEPQSCVDSGECLEQCFVNGMPTPFTGIGQCAQTCCGQVGQCHTDICTAKLACFDNPAAENALQQCQQSAECRGTCSPGGGRRAQRLTRRQRQQQRRQQRRQRQQSRRQQRRNAQR